MTEIELINRTAISRYDGWRIDILQDEASLGDLTGYAVTESQQRYCTLLAPLLRAAFPGAEVRVEPEIRTYNGGHTRVEGPDGEYAPAGNDFQRDLAQAILVSVQGIETALHEGETGDWAVDEDEDVDEG